ncbi:MAG: TipAS antibiotic-recognition domain-containing protein, partial [Gemmatimonadota bacterium]|nr:TipAS antibiotic-recognition domain-containing protein [Gemmatimonadota bacterium]
RQLLVEQRKRTDAIIRGVDAAISALENGEAMDKDTMFDGFEEFDPSKYEEEAKARWGQTDAYKESLRRTRSYSKENWAEIKAENAGILDRLVDLMASGESPESDAAMDLAEEHRGHITRWYYPCSHQMHGGLGQMYTADPRFTESFEKHGEGLADFLQKAIAANVARAADNPD